MSSTHPHGQLLGTWARGHSSDLAPAATPIQDTRSRLEASLDRLKDRVGYDWALVFVLGSEGAALVGQRCLLPDYRGLLHLLRTEPVDAGRLIVAFRGMPGVVGDICDHSDGAREFRFWIGPRLAAALGESRTVGFRSVMWFPVRQHQGAVGGVLLGHHTPHYYTARSQQAALALGEQVAALAWETYVLQQIRDQVALEEQRRLARDLHDSVAQSLYSLWLAAQTVASLFESDHAAARDLLNQVVSLTESGLAEVRSMILGLRLDSLESEGLVAALRRLVEALPARIRPQIEADLGPEPDIDPVAKEALYLIAREALSNAAKHAGAQSVTIRLRAARDGQREVELEVRDDGAGFDLSRPYPGHFGLATMRERAGAVGGTLEITSAPGSGTSVVIRIPAAVPELNPQS